MKSFPVAEGVPGFLAAGVSSGVKKNGSKDLGLLLGTKPCTVAGVFTTNRVKAAPVLLCQKRAAGGKVQAVLVNSGNANACTGTVGLQDALITCQKTAAVLGLPENLVVPCSTGVIGTPLPRAKILRTIPYLADKAGKKGIADFAGAILTTDTQPKIVTLCDNIAGEVIKICGIAKGSGMIMPQMATMLAFILTNAAIEADVLLRLLKKANEVSFNRISVDGETSTNDTALLLASGLAKKPITKRDSLAGRKFFALLQEVMQRLALLIVKDGEGATKMIKIRVVNAKSASDAKKAAFQIANANLVKTACFGGDFNWGRIMSALGSSGIAMRPEKVAIVFNGIMGVSKGQEFKANIKKLKNAFQKKLITIDINLQNGKKSYEVLTCDLSYDYIRINAAYKT